MSLNDNVSYKIAMKQKVSSSIFTERAKSVSPVNLSKAKRNFLLIDTETIGDITKGEKAFPYDISFINIKQKEITYKKCYINENIFDNEYLMNNAFYKNKIPFYKQMLKSNIDYEKTNDLEILSKLNEFIRDNKISYFLAYNVKFDYNSINNLYESKKVRNHFKKLRVIDIWKIVDTMFQIFPNLYKHYVKFCLANNYITESGKCIKSSAESVNRWINQDKEFIENHTGLEDTFCEFNILLKLLWYYEKTTKQDFYYKLDTIHNPNGTCFKNGIYTLDYIKSLKLA